MSPSAYSKLSPVEYADARDEFLRTIKDFERRNLIPKMTPAGEGFFTKIGTKKLFVLPTYASLKQVSPELAKTLTELEIPVGEMDDVVRHILNWHRYIRRSKGRPYPVREGEDPYIKLGRDLSAFSGYNVFLPGEE